MTEEIKQMFAEHEPAPGRTLGFDPDDLVAGGRRRRKRRAVGIAAGAVLTVAALTAGALALPQFVTDRSDAAADDKVEQPEYPFPDLKPPDDGFYYEIHPSREEGERSKAADEYGKAFTEWFASEQDLTFTDWPGMRVDEDEVLLFEANTENNGTLIGDPLPRYRIGPTGYDDEMPVDFEHRFGDRKVSDFLSLTVYPRGSFLDGSGDAVGHLANCEDTTGEETILDVTCTESTGPDGEKIIASDTINKERKTGDIWQKFRTVVVYRADGTAVMTNDSIPGFDGEGAHSTLDPDLDPYLSIDDLTDLALSMPDTVVKR